MNSKFDLPGMWLVAACAGAAAGLIAGVGFPKALGHEPSIPLGIGLALAGGVLAGWYAYRSTR